MAQLEIHQFPCLSDNYGVLIRDAEAGVVASIDAPSAAEVKAALAAKGWTLTHILTTHYHHDHTDGNLALKEETGCRIVGPRPEAARIPGIDETVGEGDTFKFGNFEVRVFETPGHTAGHIVYWIPDAQVAFVGDTLFAMGCGRVNEGSMAEMWSGIAKIAKLPPETVLYCGHEYTVANAKFALSVEPGNSALQARAIAVAALRAEGKPTLPTTLADELATNPFIRADSPEIRKNLDMANAEDWQVFGEVRERKNRA
ncbi:MAG: hydroxyacylglutathione hydrolase [Hyphomicrobiaceae bacterium]|nr:hydroxyacylglutathione hydrolase [Hyphomicrobiaceae bacterium]